MNKLNFSAPQNFRVINTKTGAIVESTTPNWYYILSDDGKLLESNIKTKNLKFVSAFLIPSAAIGLPDSKGIEIHAADSGLDSGGVRWFIRWCNTNSKYVGHRMTKVGDPTTINISTLLNRDFAVDSNIYQPEYHKYLQAFRQG